MDKLRASIRLILICLVLAILFLLWMPGDLLLFAFPSTSLAWRRFMIKLWGRIVAKLIGMKLIVDGSPPSMPFCLVANHLSYIDVIVAQATTGCGLISKSEVANWPVVGAVAKRIGTLFIDRSMRRDVVRVNTLIRNALESGEGIVFFPEGTTSSGKGIGPFNSSLLNYPAEVSYPVHYASLSYSSKYADPSEAICWWADMTFADHFWRLVQIPSFEARVVFGPKPVTHSDRKVLTNTLRQNIEEIFTPTGTEQT